MKKTINKGVFIPSIVILGLAGLYGFIDGEHFSELAHGAFSWILQNFGWLFQTLSMICLFTVIALFVSKKGDIRFGGTQAKARFSFMSWFAMTLAGGIATGIVLWGVNEPIVLFENIWGELDGYGITPGTMEASIFAMGRIFYHWTFIPYAMYSLAGVLMAYLYFNKGYDLRVSETLRPIVGSLADNKIFCSVVDTVSLLAIALGLASSMGGGITFISAGLLHQYGIPQGPVVWTIITLVITVIFIFSSYRGLDSGIKFFANLNTYIYFGLLILIFLIGNIPYILSLSATSFGHWLDNFFAWGFDSGFVSEYQLDASIGGSAAVQWWTLYNWAIWIAYAPLMSIFLGIIAYGRTIREFLVVNWILPSVFGLIWFSIFGITAIYWQSTGQVDIAGAIRESGAVAGMWAFMSNVNIFGFYIAPFIVPLMIIVLIISFATAADGMTTSIAILSSHGTSFGDENQEPAGWLKILWGSTISLIALSLIIFVGGVQGIDGIKFTAAAGGFAVLLVFVGQVISLYKELFILTPTLTGFNREQDHE